LRTERGWTEVVSVSSTEVVATVYNLSVEADHTYFVGGFRDVDAAWVHNSGGDDCDAAAAKPHVAAPATSSKPEWLRRLDAGNDFNRAQAARYPHNEVYVVRPDAKGYYRVDSYNPRTGEIVSRKYTQLSEVQEATGVEYINELAKKYPPGTAIADVPSSGALAGDRLRGQMIPEVPVQTKPIPKAVLDAANQKNIVIRDINGKEY